MSTVSVPRTSEAVVTTEVASRIVGHAIGEGVAAPDVAGEHADGEARGVVDADDGRVDLLVLQERRDHAHHRADAR